jgi:hypothetical protein
MYFPAFGTLIVAQATFGLLIGAILICGPFLDHDNLKWTFSLWQWDLCGFLRIQNCCREGANEKTG